MSTEAIWLEVKKLSGGKPMTVSLSGGNPAIQPLGPLIELGHSQGYRFALETQGSVGRDWFRDLDMLVLSPKPPSSGMSTDWEQVDNCLRLAAGGPEIALKIVVFDDADYVFAQQAGQRYPYVPLFLQPGNHTPPQPDDDDARVDIDGVMDRMHWLVEKVTADRWFSVRVLPQLHVLLWGNKRGV